MDLRTSPVLHPHNSAFGTPHNALDHLAAPANTRFQGHYLRSPCPVHGRTNPKLSLWANDDSTGARCHSAGCSSARIAAATAEHHEASPAQCQRDGPREGRPPTGREVVASSPSCPPRVCKDSLDPKGLRRKCLRDLQASGRATALVGA